MNDKKLLLSIRRKDFKIEYFSGTGAGGQHRNKHQNCVRLKHIESGVSSTGQNSRSRNENLRFAFRNLMNNPRFKFWLYGKINDVRCLENDLEKIVDEMMWPENLLIECKDDNDEWVEYN